MLAFTDTEVSGPALMASLQGHYDADAIASGFSYGETDSTGKWRGCAVGCTLKDFGYKTDDHSAYERAFGIPEVLARLEDGIFEGLPEGEAKRAWPLRFGAACVAQTGKDLSGVADQFLHWLLVDPEDGVIRFAKGDGIAAVQAVGDLYARRLAGDEPTGDEWRAAEAAAAAAAAAAGWRAGWRAAEAEAAGWRAAEAGWRTAEGWRTAAEAAAAAAAAGWRAGWRAAEAEAEAEAGLRATRQKQADKLIQLIGGC